MPALSVYAPPRSVFQQMSAMMGDTQVLEVISREQKVLVRIPESMFSRMLDRVKHAIRPEVPSDQRSAVNIARNKRRDPLF